MTDRVRHTHPDGPPAPADAPPADALPAELTELCGEWYQAHGAAVYGYFRFHAPAIDVAEDLTAETFLKLVRSAGRYDPAQGSVRGWILAIARNVLRDWGRRGRLRQYVPLGNLLDLACDAPSPEERLLREEEVSRLLDAVATLTDAERELIGLRYGSELDSAEVARLLGLSEGSVRTRLWRALGRLRAALLP
jgi:RNA polymerase sigma-70 factor (ECF subfamily)